MTLRRHDCTPAFQAKAGQLSIGLASSAADDLRHDATLLRVSARTNAAVSELVAVPV